MKVKSESEVTQSCPTLSNPMDCSLPDSSIHEIFQARVLEWGAIAFSGSLALTSSIFSYFTYTFLKKQISFQKYSENPFEHFFMILIGMFFLSENEMWENGEKDGERKKEKTGKKVKAAVLILGWLQG